MNKQWPLKLGLDQSMHGLSWIHMLLWEIQEWQTSKPQEDHYMEMTVYRSTPSNQQVLSRFCKLPLHFLIPKENMPTALKFQLNPTLTAVVTA